MEALKENKFPDKFPCFQCDYKAPLKSSLKRHQVDIHERQAYPCDSCDTQLPSRANILRHEQKIPWFAKV